MDKSQDDSSCVMSVRFSIPLDSMMVETYSWNKFECGNRDSTGTRENYIVFMPLRYAVM